MKIDFAEIIIVIYSVEPGWSVWRNYPSGFIFPANNPQQYAVVVTASGGQGYQADSNVSVVFSAPSKKPDDNNAISEAETAPIVEDFSSRCKIGVLDNGLVSSLTTLLTTLKENYRLIATPVDLATVCGCCRWFQRISTIFA